MAVPRSRFPFGSKIIILLFKHSGFPLYFTVHKAPLWCWDFFSGTDRRQFVVPALIKSYIPQAVNLWYCSTVFNCLLLFKMPALYVFSAAPVRFCYVPGISAVRSEVNVYTVQLISCALLSIRAKNQYDWSNNMFGLGTETQMRSHQKQRSATWHKFCCAQRKLFFQTIHQGRYKWQLIWASLKTRRGNPLERARRLPRYQFFFSPVLS